MSYILRIDCSARTAASTSRSLTDLLIPILKGRKGVTDVRCRDLISAPPQFLGEDWVSGALLDDAERTPAQAAALAHSDELIEELEGASTIVIGMPIYNFSIPAPLKAWIDQITRAGRTFLSTGAGSEGLLTGKAAYIVVASAGVPVGSEIDFATGYVRYALGYIGITDVTMFAADQQLRDPEAVPRAREAILALAQALPAPQAV